MLRRTDAASRRAALRHLQAEACRAPSDGSTDAGAGMAVVWWALADGCGSSSDEVRADCLRAACALHEQLRPVWADEALESLGCRIKRRGEMR